MRLPIACLLFFASLCFAEKKRYDDYSVLRIKPTTGPQRLMLKQLQETDVELDFWNDVRRKGPVDIMVSPSRRPSLYEWLNGRGMQHSVMIPNLQSLIEETQPAQGTPRPDFEDYKTLDQIFEFLTRMVGLCASAGLQCEVQTFGNSTEGRDLRLIKISSGASGKQAMWIDGGIHAREWISPATATFLINDLISNYNSSSEIQHMVNTYDWYIAPCVNPDGYTFTHTGDRMWRKTRSEVPGEVCVGTDMNRNYDYQWGAIGSSADPCSELFHGAFVWSEVEAIAVRDYIMGMQSQWRMFINLHSYSQYWLYQWSDAPDEPADIVDIRAVAQAGCDAIFAVHTEVYEPDSWWLLLYASSGVSQDWAYQSAGIKYSYTIELRDTGEFGFTLPAFLIRPTGEETVSGIYAAIRQIEQIGR